MNKLVVELDSVTARLAEMEEQHGGEDGVFAELDRVNKANCRVPVEGYQGATRMQTDEAAVLNDWLNLDKEEVRPQEEPQGSRSSRSTDEPTPCTLKLTQSEIKDNRGGMHKWLASLDTAIHGEMDRVRSTAHAACGGVWLSDTRFRCRGCFAVQPSLEAKINRHLETDGVHHGSERRLVKTESEVGEMS